MQKATDIHSANIANANTPGYRRQDVAYSTVREGGVNASGVHRFSPAVASRIVQLAGESSYQAALSSQLSLSSDMQSQMASDVNQSLNRFTSAFYQKAMSPNTPGLGQAVAGSGESLGSTVTNSLAGINENLAVLDRQISGAQAQGVDALKKLANLNKQIYQYGATPELVNQVAQVGREAAELVGGTLRIDPETSQAFMSLGGAVLVNGDKSAESIPATAGGKLGGFIAAKNQAVRDKTALVASIQSFTDKFNTFNQGGSTVSGTAGGEVFTFDGQVLSYTGTADGSDLGIGPMNQARKDEMTAASSLGEDLANLAGQTAFKTNSAKADLASANSSMAATEEYQQLQEGVDINAEMIAMRQAQRLYEANLKMIQVADEMLGTLLNLRA